MTDQIDYEAIRHEEMQADFERQAECERLRSQRCTECKHAYWFNKYGSLRAFRARVGNLTELGACVTDDTNDSYGITAADNALTMDCDCWVEHD